MGQRVGDFLRGGRFAELVNKQATDTCYNTPTANSGRGIRRTEKRPQSRIHPLGSQMDR